MGSICQMSTKPSNLDYKKTKLFQTNDVYISEGRIISKIVEAMPMMSPKHGSR